MVTWSVYDIKKDIHIYISVYKQQKNVSHHKWSFSSQVKFIITTEASHHKWSFSSQVKFLITSEVSHHKWSFSPQVKFLITSEVSHHKWSFSSQVKFLTTSEVSHHKWSFSSNAWRYLFRGVMCSYFNKMLTRNKYFCLI